MVKGKRWTREEEEFLIRNYGTMDNRTLATLLGRTVDSVTHKANRLGLKKSKRFWDDYYMKRCKRRLAELAGHDSVKAF